MKKKFIHIFSLLLLQFYLFAQNPVIDNSKLSGKISQYSRDDFNADPQFWSMTRSNDGKLFFGNNDGVLIFDGEHWQKLNLPNNSSVRSLAISKDGDIYAGGYNEIGKLQKNKEGRYFYKSLMEELQLEGKNVENIWAIHTLGNRVLCRSFNELLIISNNIATHIPANNTFIYSNLVGEDYYIQDSNYGILKLSKSSNAPVMVFTREQYNNEEIAAILPGNSSSEIIVISKQGNIYKGSATNSILKLTSNIFGKSQRDYVSSAIKYPNGDIFIGTLSSKIIIVNNNGEVKPSPALFQTLQEAVIHRLYMMPDGNLWVLENNGLAYIDFKSPYSYLFNKASVYDALVFKNNIYLATNQGIYFSYFNSFNPSATHDFKKIENLHGQAWSIRQEEGDIIVGHDNGLFRINNEIAEKIGPVSGFWKIIPIKSKPHHYLAAHYNGLYLLEKKDGQWLLHEKLGGFDESARDILPSDEPYTYWVCHGYKGVFRIRINPSYTRVSSVDHYTNKNGLESAFNVNVTRWNNDIVFTTNTGIYRFDIKKNRFVTHSKLNSILDPSKNTRKLMQAGNKTWFVQDDEAGYFFTAEKKPELHKDLFLNLKGSFNRGMESIVTISGSNVLFGTTNGLFLYTIAKPGTSAGVNTVITQVSYSQNQQLNLLSLSNKKEEPQVLPNQTDILRFEFASPKMTHGTQVQYSYMLENVDNSWSAWQNISFKEYTHLRPGTYIFKVCSRNTAGLLGAESKYYFTILPKWYETHLAIALYIIIAALLIILIVRYVKRRIERDHEKTRNEALKAKKMLELELEQLKLQRDKEQINKDRIILQEEVLNNSKELANYTMLLIKKKDIFNELTTDLKELKDYVKNDDSRKKLLQIFQKLNTHKIGEEYLEVFDVNFEKVHHNFFEELKKLNPTLTKRELRLCAFVKMNLTNKEISPLLNISLRGVENARYRIRKKLEVAHEDNFVAFLENIAKEAEASA
ncbi:triple tyrosine motif-containing protein [Flavobacterium sp. DG1-102-2]|uniref:helix-turn-helix and ligand-binding sensor domain-containing protein n=1 Tax=Flavobacterium sp. DG1-102-2 TaxID=3081663 RepID=UPI00294A6412|nr:triple tyrosine motif-containing protein [Flavobacterium sp. DG1-102-2]MDV6169654.1 triple tyrosine motif-containing protein [Flavobacterium sp. DG1-102-2]